MAKPDPKPPGARFEALDPPRVEPASRARKNAAAGAVPRSSAKVNAGADATAAGHPKPASLSPPGIVPVVKPLQHAVAITYQSSAGAPKVVAKGRGLIAEQIIARAREHGVFVHESKELVALLMQVELDDQIPPALYRAVAELLAWLYRIETARLDGGKVS